MKNQYRIQQHPNGYKVNIGPTKNPMPLIFILLLIGAIVAVAVLKPELAQPESLASPLAILILLVALLLLIGWLRTALWEMSGTEEIILTEKGALIKRKRGSARKRERIHFPPKPRNKQFQTTRFSAEKIGGPRLLRLSLKGRVRLEMPAEQVRIGRRLSASQAESLAEKMREFSIG